MDCKAAEKMIAGYIAGTLSDNDTKSLINHVEGCAACKEEMTIQFLVSEGLNHLEDRNNFDLLQELDNKMKMSMHKIKIRRGFRISMYIAWALAFIAIVAAILIIAL